MMIKEAFASQDKKAQAGRLDNLAQLISSSLATGRREFVDISLHSGFKSCELCIRDTEHSRNIATISSPEEGLYRISFPEGRVVEETSANSVVEDIKGPVNVAYSEDIYEPPRKTEYSSIWLKHAFYGGVVAGVVASFTGLFSLAKYLNEQGQGGLKDNRFPKVFSLRASAEELPEVPEDIIFPETTGGHDEEERQEDVPEP